MGRDMGGRGVQFDTMYIKGYVYVYVYICMSVYIYIYIHTCELPVARPGGPYVNNVRFKINKQW